MKIIQIRGSNGAGKTTVVRQFIAGRESEIIQVKVGNKTVQCTKVGDGVVIGRYDQNVCGGCDSAVKGADTLKDCIAAIAKKKPEFIVFEGVLYGQTFDFSYQISKLAKILNAEYVALCLESPFAMNIERIYGRNGGKPIKVKALCDKYYRTLVNHVKLRDAGVNAISVDTTNVPLEKMGEILEEVIG